MSKNNVVKQPAGSKGETDKKDNPKDKGKSGFSNKDKRSDIVRNMLNTEKDKKSFFVKKSY